MLFTPICQHSLSFRPVILSDSARLELKQNMGSSFSRATHHTKLNMRPSTSSLPEDIGSSITSLPDDTTIEGIFSAVGRDIASSIILLPENIGALISSLPDNVTIDDKFFSSVSLLPDDKGSSVSSLPGDMTIEKMFSAVGRNIASSNLLPDNKGSFASSLSVDMTIERIYSAVGRNIASSVSLLPENMGSSVSSLHDDMTIEKIFSAAGGDIASSLSLLPRDIINDSYYSALLNITSENTRVPDISLPEDTIDAIATFNSAYMNIISDIAKIDRILSYEDTFRLIRMEAVYESNSQGKYLAFSDENDTFILVEAVGNGFIPLHAMFAAPYTSLLDNMGLIFRGVIRGVLKPSDDDHVRGKMSPELSKYIWPSDQDAIYVQFRSPVPYFHPFYSKLKVVFGKNGGGDDGEYCLAACNDGTVKWLLPSECGNGNHVWTVHLFDPPYKGEAHLSQILERRGVIADNNQVNVINNNNFGGNRNESGSQIIGTINYQTELNLHLAKTNLQQKK